MRDLLFRLRALFRRSAVEREINEELRAHLEHQATAYERKGMPRAEAVRRARLDLGGLAQTQEDYRDALGIRLLDQLQRDVRVAVRSLRAAPVVTTVAVLSLSLAIGATTSVFALADALLLRTLPVSNPERLVMLTDSTGTPHVRAWSYAVWRGIQHRTSLLESASAFSFVQFNSARSGETQPVSGLWVDGSFLRTLGVAPTIGRALSERDDQRGGGPDGLVAMISHPYWQRHFGGAADVVGRSIRLNSVTFRIVGVTPPGFFGTEVGRAFEVMVPLSAEALVNRSGSALDEPARNFLTIFGRLKAGQPIQTAEDELRRLQSAVRSATIGAWDKDVADRYLKAPFTLVPAANGYSNLRRTYKQPLLTIGFVVGVVLLVACVNVANLLLARASGRRHELTVRLALGGSRWRIARQLFTESLLLSGIGAFAGLALATASSRFIVAELLSPTNLASLDLSMDDRVLFVTIAVTVFTTLIFGTVPALWATRAQPIDALKLQGRTSTDAGHVRIMGSLLVLQVAMSMVLLVASGLFLRSFLSLTNRPLGLQPDAVLVAVIDSPAAVTNPQERLQLYLRARERVLSVPNVSEAAVSHRVPLEGGGFTPAVEISAPRGSVVAPVSVPANRDVFGNLVSTGWFRTFGTRVMLGRDFADDERRGAPRVAIVNEAFVRRFMAGREPLGHIITLYPNTPRALSSIQIVGVVEDAVYGSPRDPIPPTWYVPIEQFDLPGWSFGSARLSVRVESGSPERLRETVAVAISASHSDVTMTFVSLGPRLHYWLTVDRLLAQLAGFFGLLTLVLAAIGLYGVTAYAVMRRRTEIGVRMALGAAPMMVVRAVVGRVSLVTGAGIVAGAVASYWALQFVSTLLFGLEPGDQMSLAFAAVTLLTVGIVAAGIPAVRATRIDPTTVLRQG